MFEFVILIFSISSLFAGLIGLSIDVDKLGGPIYIKLIIGSFLILIGAIFSGGLLLYFDGFKTLKISLFISASSLLIYVFCPIDMKSMSSVA